MSTQPDLFTLQPALPPDPEQFGTIVRFCYDRAGHLTWKERDDLVHCITYLADLRPVPEKLRARMMAIYERIK